MLFRSALSSTIFTVVLKLKKDKNERIREEREVLKEEMKGKNVIIVDDNATNRSIFEKMTSSWGMINYVAESGKEALEILKENNEIEIAILDYHMPEMNGVQLSQKIRENEKIKDIAIHSSHNF